MIKIKSGVEVKLITKEIFNILRDIDIIWKMRTNVEPVITSWAEKVKKRSESSLHYKNQAIDLRINNLSSYQTHNVYLDLKNTLGSNYDVVLESDHIHIEYDPKIQGKKKQECLEKLKLHCNNTKCKNCGFSDNDNSSGCYFNGIPASWYIKNIEETGEPDYAGKCKKKRRQVPGC